MDLLDERDEIAKRMRMAYKASGKTWREIATETGVSEGHLQRLGKRKYDPSASIVKRFAKATGVSVAWLLDEPEAPAGSPEGDLDPGAKAVLAAYRELGKATSRALLVVLVGAGISPGTRAALRSLAALVEEQGLLEEVERRITAGAQAKPTKRSEARRKNA